MYAKDLPGLFLNFSTALAVIHQGQGAVGLVAKDDGDAVEFYGVHLRVTLSIRSSRMATTTMMKPDSNPSAVLTEFSARTTGTPSPFAPTRAAITTIDSDSMMVWFRPAMICGKA